MCPGRRLRGSRVAELRYRKFGNEASTRGGFDRRTADPLSVLARVVHRTGKTMRLDWQKLNVGRGMDKILGKEGSKLVVARRSKWAITASQGAQRADHDSYVIRTRHRWP